MFYNCHIHIFRDIDVPRKFLPLALVSILATKAGAWLLDKALHNAIWWSKNDKLDRYVRFTTIGRLGSQKKIFEECRKFYPDDTKFVVLPMDMVFMEAGTVPRNYRDQLKELAELKKEYPQIIPFIHADPRRKEIFDLVKECVEEWGFRGVKLYPLLGYFPYDEGLYPVYEYCQQYRLPVIAHCSSFNAVHYRGSNKDLCKLLTKSKVPIDIKGKKHKELFACFTDPANYKYVLDDFKNLRICVAHFGSGDAWEEFLDNPGNKANWLVVLKEMMAIYKNLYTDISFTLNDQKYFSLLKVLLADQQINSQILFGTDYYMVETESEERRFGLDLRAFIGEELFKKIALENTEAFLY